MADVIAEELNVKSVEFGTDESRFVSLTAKANFKALGSRLGKRMKAAASAIEALPSEELERLRGGETITLEIGDGSPAVELSADDVLVQRIEHEGMTVANEGAVTIALDTRLDQALINEGMAREFVSKVQAMRKDNGYDVSQRISIRYEADSATAAAIAGHADYICAETLCTDFAQGSSSDAAKVDINGNPVKITLSKK